MEQVGDKPEEVRRHLEEERSPDGGNRSGDDEGTDRTGAEEDGEEDGATGA